jgi:hypothetical protein
MAFLTGSFGRLICWTLGFHIGHSHERLGKQENIVLFLKTPVVFSHGLGGLPSACYREADSGKLAVRPVLCTGQSAEILALRDGVSLEFCNARLQRGSRNSIVHALKNSIKT